MSGNWRYLRGDTEEFPGNGRVMVMVVARLEMYPVNIFIGVSVLNFRCIRLHFSTSVNQI